MVELVRVSNPSPSPSPTKKVEAPERAVPSPRLGVGGAAAAVGGVDCSVSCRRNAFNAMVRVGVWAQR